MEYRLLLPFSFLLDFTKELMNDHRQLVLAGDKVSFIFFIPSIGLDISSISIS